MRQVADRSLRSRFAGSQFRIGSFRGLQSVQPAFGKLEGLRAKQVITSKNYTFYIATTPGKLKKLIVPAYVLHGIAVLAIIGAITVTAAVGAYSRMLWKVGNFNALRQYQEQLKRQYLQLQSTATDTNQRLASLQSLPNEVDMTYGVLRYHPAAFDTTESEVTPEDAFDRTIEDRKSVV